MLKSIRPSHITKSNKKIISNELKTHERISWPLGMLITSPPSQYDSWILNFIYLCVCIYFIRGRERGRNRSTHTHTRACTSDCMHCHIRSEDNLQDLVFFFCFVFSLFIMGILGIKLKSRGLVTSVLTCWAILLTRVSHIIHSRRPVVVILAVTPQNACHTLPLSSTVYFSVTHFPQSTSTTVLLAFQEFFFNLIQMIFPLFFWFLVYEDTAEFGIIWEFHSAFWSLSAANSSLNSFYPEAACGMWLQFFAICWVWLYSPEAGSLQRHLPLNLRRAVSYGGE